MSNEDLLITSQEEFQSVIVSLENSVKKIQDIFAREEKNSMEIDGTNTWTGKAQNTFHSKYIELIENFAPIEYSLDLYVKFLKKTLEDYMLLIKEMNQNIDEAAMAMDVNS